MIAIRGAGYVTAGCSLVSDVSFTLPAGRLVVLAGPNGAGKSTLVRMLSGEIRASAGEVSLLGRPLQSWPLCQQARLRAVLPQGDRVRFPLTVRDVVSLGRAPWTAVAAPRDAEAVRRAMAAMSVEHLARRCFLDLSGGERQRVHLARVLAQLDPWTPQGGRFLLLDEPVAGLDPAHQHHVLSLVRELVRGGIGALAVLHDLNLAALYADDVALMNRGKLVAFGAADRVLTAQNVRDVFGLSVHVMNHPRHDRPLLIADPEPMVEACST